MSRPSSDVAFSPSVKAVQEARGSRAHYARIEARGGWQMAITADLARFIAERTSFYLASASAEGQPYMQHRGGPPGFLKVIDDRTIGLADFAGNRQYITTGNLAENPKAMLFLMDYETQRRVKIWTNARVVTGDIDLMTRLFPHGYKARVEQAILFDVLAWDINCNQHIPLLFKAEDVAGTMQKVEGHIRALEAENAALKERIAVLEAACDAG